jgi:hypothetical protein
LWRSGMFKVMVATAPSIDSSTLAGKWFIQQSRQQN